MSAPRTITVRLTEAQFRAIAGAVEERAESLADQIDHKMPGATREAATLERGWDALKGGWYGHSTRLGEDTRR